MSNETETKAADFEDLRRPIDSPADAQRIARAQQLDAANAKWRQQIDAQRAADEAAIAKLADEVRKGMRAPSDSGPSPVFDACVISVCLLTALCLVCAALGWIGGAL